MFMFDTFVRVCVYFMFLLFLLRGGRMGALSSVYKLTRLILQIECPSYHLTSLKKSALTQNSSAQTPKAIHQYGIVEKTNNKQ